MGGLPRAASAAAAPRPSAEGRDSSLPRPPGVAVGARRRDARACAGGFTGVPRGCEVLVAGLCALLALATTAGDDARQHAAVRPQRLAGTATATRRQPAGSQACERWVCHGAARLRGGAEEASASSSRGAAEEPVLAASLPSAETFDSDDSLVVAAGGARAVSNTEAEGARAGAVPLRPRPPGPKPARAPRQEGSSRASAPDSREPEGEQADGAPPRPRWKHPLPIPAGAEGFELWRWLQARNMGEEFYDVDGLGRADVAHEERSGPDGGSWIAKMEKTQTNVKEPTDDPYSMDALLGEDMTQYFPDGATEHLWWACEYGNAEAARAALEAGAQVNFTHARYHCRTPLHSAASLGEVDDEIVRMLIDAGADVNAEDEVGCRPLHMASESWDPDKVRALVEAGAEKNHTNGHGYTPLQVARACYDACQDPNLEPNPDYDPKWEAEMMSLLAHEGGAAYPTIWPLHSTEIAAAGGGDASAGPAGKGKGAAASDATVKFA